MIVRIIPVGYYFVARLVVELPLASKMFGFRGVSQNWEVPRGYIGACYVGIMEEQMETTV